MFLLSDNLFIFSHSITLPISALIKLSALALLFMSLKESIVLKCYVMLGGWGVYAQALRSITRGCRVFTRALCIVNVFIFSYILNTAWLTGMSEQQADHNGTVLPRPNVIGENVIMKEHSTRSRCLITERHCSIICLATMVGSSAVRAPPVAAAAKMRFDAKIAVISTGYSSHKSYVIKRPSKHLSMLYTMK